VPVIITFHGSDINIRKLNFISSIVSYLSTWRIFVSKELHTKILLAPSKNYKIIPCGINLDIFRFIDKKEARVLLGLSHTKKYILFASAFDNPIKNFPLARKALDLIEEEFDLLELNNRSREEVCLLLNASDLLLLTSRSEGSPQVIKEALACNCPIVATDVGEIEKMIYNVSNSYIVNFDAYNIAEKIRLILKSGERANGREMALPYDNNLIAKKIIDIYRKIVPASSYQICSKTIIDSTVPGVVFDDQGVSNYCKIFDNLVLQYPRGQKGISDLNAMLTKIKTDGRKKRYDCIIGVSGGTDSSYLLHLAKEYGLRPLAVNLDNGWNSEISYSNILKVTKKLNIDLETYVIDYEEIKDLMVCYMKASLPWIDNPTDLAIQSILYKIGFKEKIKYILIGNDFRTEGKQPTEWTYSDARQLMHVHKKFGRTKLKSYPLLSLWELYYLSVLKGMEMISVYHYADYQKKQAQAFLKKEYDWQYYGEHHHENLFTKFAIANWLPKKFNIDKRIITYSAQILSGEISRGEAIEIIKNEPYPEDEMERDQEYVIKKLGLTQKEFDEIWNKPNKSFLDYPSYYPMIRRFVKLIMPFATNLLKVKPKIFFEMEVRNNTILNV
jgi:N-acetyl sugar amidotransferase